MVTAVLNAIDAPAFNMRECWNWQTGMTKDHVSKGVGVQVPSLAPKIQDTIRYPVFFCLPGGT